MLRELNLTSLRLAIPLVMCLACSYSWGNSSHIQLPELGDSVSGSVSQHQEAFLGQTWLSFFRAQAPVREDALVNLYAEDLLYRLASESQLKNRQLSLVIVENKSLNAFAVPGGVIGLHDGLFLLTQNEDQLASVLSHELAHLSQRHYARSLEEAKRNAVPAFASILAGIVLAATAGGEAGIAAITAGQALNAQNRLSFSRQNEQEADRVGMQTLFNAGFNPQQVPAMFEIMQRNDRYYSKNSDFLAFLRTHPLTESRISDTRLRAQQYPKRPTSSNNMFALMRARIQVFSSESPGTAVKQAKADLQGQANDVNRYRLALAYLEAAQSKLAQPLVEQLYQQDSDSIVYQLLQAQLYQSQNKLTKSKTLLSQSLALNPHNHALTMDYVEVLLQLKQFSQAKTLLEAHSLKRPNDPQIWYLLAEANGLAGDILAVHESRAEYFVLLGNLDQANKQLEYALKTLNLDRNTSSRLYARIDEIKETKELQEKLFK